MKAILFFLFISLGIHSNAQNETKNWFFGDSLMMNFFETDITAYQIPSEIVQEASASISDSTGNLLFYTDGKYVWDKLNEVMPNGCCLDIWEYGYDASSETQGVIILPMPSETKKYYVITIGEDSLFYSVVDMTLNGGLGDVEEKNTLIFSDTLTEKMHAVRHGNGRDWWLVVHKQIWGFDPDLTNTFFEFLITPSGITGPYEQNAGAMLDHYTSWGQMIFSPDGSKLALTAYKFLDIFNFDRCSGNLTELVNIDNFDIPNFNSYGCSFSPDGNKVYISNTAQSTTNVYLYQYCLNCNDSIKNTKQLLYHNNISHYGIGQHMLGPDGKIYFVIGRNEDPVDIFSEYNMNLCVINNPNEYGLACNVDTSTIWLGGRVAICGLPNMVNYDLGALTGSTCDTLETTATEVNNIINNNISIYPNPATNYFTISGSTMGKINIELYNLFGQIVFTKNNVPLNSPVYFNGINAGMYEVTVKRENNIIYTGKIAIAR